MERSTSELEYLLNILISNVRKAERLKLDADFDTSRLKQSTFNKLNNKICKTKERIIKIYKAYTI